MQTHIATTPFGRRPMSLGQISSQMAAKAAAHHTTVNKWQAFQHIREARDLLGATDRSLAILNALLSFHRETELVGAGELIVWPSNEQLMARANGMPPTTLRRHLAVLVDCGLIIRRDSPNGKRFARKGRGGEIEQAYGFDLSPIVARAEEFKDLAEAVQVEKKAFRVARERLTLLRRDIVKMIDMGVEEKITGNWGRVLQAYQVIIDRLPRSASRQLVESVCEDLKELWAEIREVLETFTKSQNTDANASHFGRHIQNSKPDSNSESKNRTGDKQEASTNVAEIDNIRDLPERELPLGIVLDACPGICEIAQNGQIRHWRELLAAAEALRPMTGISPSAWHDAKAVLGEKRAAITLAAIYQKGDQVNNAGGYLRSLTERAREEKFSTWPMIMALLRAKLEGSKAIEDGSVGAGTFEPHLRATHPNDEGLHASEALRRNLEKPKWR